jgi:riboflavin transporter
MKTTTFRIALLALFIALAAVGANVKIMGSIAFDSLPAFLAAMLIGGKEGAIAGAAGHLFSALLAGFPYTLPMHLAIAAEMAAICWLLGWMVQNKNVRIWVAAIPAFVLNAFVSPLLVVVWPGFGWEMMLGLFIPLVIASAANVAAAAILAYALKKPLKRYLVPQH